MPDTPQQRTDDTEDRLGTTPDAPQARADEAGDARDTDESRGLQTPVTREEVERRQLDDEVDTVE